MVNQNSLEDVIVAKNKDMGKVNAQRKPSLKESVTIAKKRT